MNKTDAELRREIGQFGAFADGGGWVIVFGVLMEAGFSQINLSEVIPDMIVAGGVAAEILFARKASACAAELQRRSDILIAEANERSANAQLELERLKMPRRLSEAQSVAISTRLEAFKGQKALVIASSVTYEGAVFADQIHRSLISASLTAVRLDRWLPTRGSIIAEDVFVTFSEEDSESAHLAHAIVRAFMEEGIKAEAASSPPDWWPAILGHALVVVGDKS